MKSNKIFHEIILELMNSQRVPLANWPSYLSVYCARYLLFGFK